MEGGQGWGLTWKVRQFSLLILQSGHIVAGILPLILGGDRVRHQYYPLPSPKPAPKNLERTGEFTCPHRSPGASDWPCLGHSVC